MSRRGDSSSRGCSVATARSVALCLGWHAQIRARLRCVISLRVGEDTRTTASRGQHAPLQLDESRGAPCSPSSLIHSARPKPMAAGIAALVERLSVVSAAAIPLRARLLEQRRIGDRSAPPPSESSLLKKRRRLPSISPATLARRNHHTTTRGGPSPPPSSTWSRSEIRLPLAAREPLPPRRTQTSVSAPRHCATCGNRRQCLAGEKGRGG